MSLMKWFRIGPAICPRSAVLGIGQRTRAKTDCRGLAAGRIRNHLINEVFKNGLLNMANVFCHTGLISA